MTTLPIELINGRRYVPLEEYDRLLAIESVHPPKLADIGKR